MKIKKLDLVCIAFITLMMLGLWKICHFTGSGDFLFHYNRLSQMAQELKNGHFPDFYFNDLLGVGYGNSFFYGQLTLLPFIPLLALGHRAVYFAMNLLSMILHWLGFRFFSKRFTKNYLQITVIYVGSTLFVEAYSGMDILINWTNVAISWFFLGYCIDFFRNSDKMAKYKAALLFFLMINTHLTSSAIALGVCFILWLLYFDKSRIIEYIKFALASFLLSSFWLTRMLWQWGVVSKIDSINSDLLKHIDRAAGRGVSAYQNPIPFVGIPEAVYIGGKLFNNGFGYLSMFVTIFIAVIWFKNRRKLSNREKIVLLICVVCMLIAPIEIWKIINDKVNLIIQFSVRYAFYILGAGLLIVFRYIDFSTKKTKQLFLCLLLLSLPDLLVFGSVTSIYDNDGSKLDYDKLANIMDFVAEGIKTDYSNIITDKDYFTMFHGQVVNGEYLDESFDTYHTEAIIKDYVLTDSKDKLNFEKQSRSISFTVTEGTREITLPKIWYKGYHLRSPEGKEFNIWMGDGQYIHADVSSYSGDLILSWELPFGLHFIRLVNIISIGGILYAIFKKSSKRNIYSI